uniref:Endonuclease/exonuclease/phosphatase domain-containing protein n=1 Tax=Maylandia zebra TaxID=106582 RepID=A0A3P9D136_9CICH
MERLENFENQSRRGVITLIHKNLPFSVTATHKDNDGRYILVKGMLHGKTVLLGNIYAPNPQDDEFCRILFSQLMDMDCANIILASDFNCVLCPKMDKSPPQSTSSKNSKTLWQIINELDLIQGFGHISELQHHWSAQKHKVCNTQRHGQGKKG